MSSRLFLYLLSITSLLEFASAQSTPEDFCRTNFGPQYVPQYDATGAFNGNCVTPPITVCLGTEYNHPKTGAKICCPPGQVLKVDASVNEAGCCDPAQVFQWSAGASSGICTTQTTPPAPVPTISCPGSHLQWINRNGVNFRVFCDHFVKEWVPPWQAAQSLFMLATNTVPAGSDTFDSCLNKCAADVKCNGANFWVNKRNCSMQNKGKQGSIFSGGDLYLANPPYAITGRPVIAIVAIPRRV
ncbi:hypothetical protein L211DRAFT_844311 [Terfezia boudieri ATCC MYA-4762]|uniref:Apple domain-containing protein n=1 Tax=Terfezia boudieri ATCC MYA-4762 TaxID=1051890 RepID=A0A3N4M2N6_9PEZI|nr:hypothetical protein L211DRAFT_844311 [Terfezia boudieri ATCC MYA-4762]